MSNELIAFLCGGCGGIFIGGVLSALFITISKKIEGDTDK